MTTELRKEDDLSSFFVLSILSFFLSFSFMRRSSPDLFRNMIDILRFDGGLEIFFKHTSEEILKLRATEVTQYLLPVWGILIVA